MPLCGTAFFGEIFLLDYCFRGDDKRRGSWSVARGTNNERKIMAKPKKEKTLKTSKSSKKSKEIDAPMMPTIIEGLAKLVERLEIVERKVDQVNSRISNILFEIRGEIQQSSRQQNASHQQNPFSYAPPQRPMQSLPPRQMYQVVCADCKKNTEVPFKPGDRPVYCKECFAARKSGVPVLTQATAVQKAEEKASSKPAKNFAVKSKKSKK